MKAGNGSHYIWKYLDSFSKALAPARKQYRIGPLFTQERRFRSDFCNRAKLRHFSVEC